MFYEPGVTSHNLPHDPFKSCVVPRPIGWISTINPVTKVPNLAPYSQFQNLSFDPPYVMFSSNNDPSEGKESGERGLKQGYKKDSAFNAEMSGEFVWNMATHELREKVNWTAGNWYPEEDEFEKCGLTKAPSKIVKPFRVEESPIQFECKVYTTLRLPGNSVVGTVDVVIGKVVGIHIKEGSLNDKGIIDIPKIKPLARLGYYQYTHVENVWDMIIPSIHGNDSVNAGMEGSAKVFHKLEDDKKRENA